MSNAIKVLIYSFLSICYLMLSTVGANQPANGLWQGSFDINGNGNYDFTGLYVDGKMVAVSNDARVVYRGDYSVQGSEHLSSLTLYQLDGNPFDIANLTGSISGEPPEIDSRFMTVNGQDSGMLKLAYSSVYEKQSSTKIVQGEWNISSPDFNLNMSIDAAGELKATDSEGCVYKGTIKSINPEFNAYSIEAVVSSCGSVDGDYRGMAYCGKGNSDQSDLNIFMLSDNYGFFFPMSQAGTEADKVTASN